MSVTVRDIMHVVHLATYVHSLLKICLQMNVDKFSYY